jgi:hypothetical protein
LWSSYRRIRPRMSSWPSPSRSLMKGLMLLQ